MVSLPDHQPSYMQEKTQKPHYFFKSVDLTMDGFKFTECEEFEVDDQMPKTIRKLSHFDHNIFMNDFYIVILDQQRRSASIIYKKNMKYVETEDEIPNSYPQPYFLDRICFNRDTERFFYLYVKLLEVNRVRLSFDSYICNVVFNGDQIFFVFKAFIISYTPLATCTMEIAAIDVAVNFYMYVLTSNQILIYNEALYKTIDIDKKCKFIVPASSHIFVIRHSFIYKIVDDMAELYFDTLHHVRDVVFDDRSMYIATEFSIMKIGLYECVTESISIKISVPKLKICDDYLIVHNSNNGIAFLDKKDLQRFNFRLFNWDVKGVAAYRNEIAYLGSEELRLFKFAKVNGNLEPVNKVKDYSDKYQECTITPTTINLPSDIIRVINDKLVSLPYNYYGMTFNCFKFQAYDKVKAFKYNSQEAFDEDLKRLAEAAENKSAPEIKDDMATNNPVRPTLDTIPTDILALPTPSTNNEQQTEKVKGKRGRKKKSSIVVNPVQPPAKISSVAVESIKSIKPESNLLLDKVLSQMALLPACEENSTGKLKNNDNPIQEKRKRGRNGGRKKGSKNRHAFIKPLENIECDRRIRKVNTHMREKKIDAQDELSSDDSDSGLFFDDEEYVESKKLGNNRLLTHIAKYIPHRRKSIVKQTKQRLYSCFGRSKEFYIVNNPYTYLNPLDAFDKGHIKLIRFSRNYETYQRTSFFCRNHFKFFKKRFKPRDYEEKVGKYHIYNLIDEEFKKIVGYKSEKDTQIEKKIDLSKRARGGF